MNSANDRTHYYHLNRAIKTALPSFANKVINLKQQNPVDGTMMCIGQEIGDSALGYLASEYIASIPYAKVDSLEIMFSLLTDNGLAKMLEPLPDGFKWLVDFVGYIPALEMRQFIEGARALYTALVEDAE